VKGIEHEALKKECEMEG
jgi:hypothetical protein